MTLAPDAELIRQDVSDIVVWLRPVNVYAGHLQSPHLSPQPLRPGGEPWDPLKTEPALKAAIGAALVHAQEFQHAFSPMVTWFLFLPNTTHQFHQATCKIQAIADRCASREPTAAERQEVDELFAILVEFSVNAQATVQGAVSSLATFAEQLGPDSRAFVEGETSLDTRIPRLQQQITEQMVKYMMDPASRGLAGILGDLGGRMISALESVRSSVRGLKVESQAIRASSAQLLGRFVNIRTAYADAARILAKAKGAEFASAIRKMDLIVARKKWELVGEYASKELLK